MGGGVEVVEGEREKEGERRTRNERGKKPLRWFLERGEKKKLHLPSLSLSFSTSPRFPLYSHCATVPIEAPRRPGRKTEKKERVCRKVCVPREGETRSNAAASSSIVRRLGRRARRASLLLLPEEKPRRAQGGCCHGFCGDAATEKKGDGGCALSMEAGERRMEQ